jgi:alpha-beta hydrolase superfamily lysophospholipase
MMMALIKVGGTENPDRVGDVVFVHGLNGDPRASWSSTEANFWPHWLAQDCPMLGIWSIGYNAAASAWRGTAMSLFDRANNLLAELQAEGVGTKPLCFIAHSMGGLLVKQMLRNADSVAPEFHLFSSAVRGVIFLATPHTGSNLANLVHYLKFFLRPTVAVRELENAASALRELNLWYRQNADRLNIKTQVYFETQRTHGVQVVDEDSADPGIRDVTPIGIDASHITIAKPASRESLVYSRIKQSVVTMLVTVEPQARIRRPEETIEAHVVHNAASMAARVHPQPFLVPPLPPQGVIGRERNLAYISMRLALFENNMTEVPPLALRGMGGVGKTTLALALGRQERVRSFFPDGVLWVELGPHPIIRTLLNDWGHALGVDLLPERDENACQDRLRDILSRRRVLLIVDDVWEVEHGNKFQVAGPFCRLLFTTRESPIAYTLATRERTIHVDVLGADAALQLLGALVPEAVATDQRAARRLCEKLEFLPLALKLAGRLLANEADVPRRMQRLIDELTEQRQARLALEQLEGRRGLTEDNPVSLRDILGLSVNRLSPPDQKRFAQLAVFGGEPLTWEIKAAASVWECSQEEAEATTARLIQRGLVEPRPEERYWMHALLADYAEEMMEESGL